LCSILQGLVVIISWPVFLYLKQGERMTKSEVQEILDDADINNDGKLDYNEVNEQSPGCRTLYVLEDYMLCKG